MGSLRHATPVCAMPRLDHRAQAGMSRSPSHFGRQAGTSRSPSHIVSAPGRAGWLATPHWHLRRTGQTIGPGAVRPLAPHSRASVPAVTAGSGSPYRTIALSSPDHRDPGRLVPGSPRRPDPTLRAGIGLRPRATTSTTFTVTAGSDSSAGRCTHMGLDPAPMLKAGRYSRMV